jgi:beta-glucanase (GH16 family)
MPHLGRIGAFAFALSAVSVLAVVPGTARAADPFTQISLTAAVNGGSVTATAAVGASTSTTVQSYGICVRGAGGEKLDFPKVAEAVITVGGTPISRSKSMAAGTYTYFPCLQKSGVWYEVGTKKQFSVGNGAATTTAPTTSTTTTTQSSTAPATTSTSPTTNIEITSATSSGTAQPAGRQIFVDDFNGSANQLPDAAKWGYQVGGGGWGNNELQYYTNADADNASLDGNGHLRITVRSEQIGGRNYSSARLRTMGKFDFLYGTMEARIKLPAGSGLWPAFWTQGTKDNAGQQDDWPRMGEIDVMEAVNSDKGYAATIHAGPSHWSVYKWFSKPARDDLFHNYKAVWSPGTISFYVDDMLVNTVNKSATPSGKTWPFDNARQYLMLNVAMGGNYPGAPNGSATLPATMLVDYVRVTQ